MSVKEKIKGKLVKKGPHKKKIIYYTTRQKRADLKASSSVFNKKWVLGLGALSCVCLVALGGSFYFQQAKPQPDQLIRTTKEFSNMIIDPETEQSVKDTNQEVLPIKQKSEPSTVPVEEVPPIQKMVEKAPEPEQPQFYQVKIGDNLSKIAENNGLTLEELREYNHLTTDLLVVGQQLSLLKGRNESIQPSENSENLSQTYLVQTGDTLFKIAQKTGLTVEDLRQVNRLNSSELSPGQTLRLEQLTPQFTPAISSVESEKQFYTVQEGDTLYRIATNLGTTVEQLQELNSLSEYVIQTGRALRVK